MIPQLILDNLVSWGAQVLIIGSIGALLPAVFRIRHPRSQLVYCHLVLIACVLLPMIEPLHHPVVTIKPAQESQRVVSPVNVPAVGSQRANIPWKNVVAWLIVSGAVARLSWTALGLWRIRRYKVAATPLYPFPESVEDALSGVGVSAAFCVSSDSIGPVTFGFFKPVVLLPESFLSLDRSAQCGIACHELLHVRRRDWLITVIEEIVAGVFWFHPAFWWLLGQVRLSREQVVDAEVVAIIADREPYINALLTMAGAQSGLDLAPAPLFLRRRHLLQRMHSLITEVSMSKFRLLSSYGSIMTILTVAAWMGFVSFPLSGRAEIKEVASSAPAPTATPAQSSPGYVVNIQPLSYPPDAIQKKIEGTVVVELTFNADGRIIDSRVLSGPDELRASALESALKGNYSITVARTLQVLVDFKLANARVVGQRGGARGANSVPPPPPPFQSPNSSNATVSIIDIRGLLDPQLSDLRQRLKSLEGQGQRQAVDQIGQVVRESGITTPYAVATSLSDDKVTILLIFGNGNLGTIRTPFGDVVPNGSVQTPFGPAPLTPPPTIPPISTVDPVYPPLARQARIQGVVVMDAQINTEGKVENIRVVTGHPLLVQAAIDAVKQWVYPTQASPVRTSVIVNFALPQ